MTEPLNPESDNLMERVMARQELVLPNSNPEAFDQWVEPFGGKDEFGKMGTMFATSALGSLAEAVVEGKDPLPVLRATYLTAIQYGVELGRYADSPVAA